MKPTGTILVLAYPDTFVTMSTEWICRILPLVGLGTREYIKAGHAALVLIENETGKARYFDFGRYVTPQGLGRVRGANTDAELEIPFTAEFLKSGLLKNLDDFLLWLDANPQKTHGEGRLLASVCESIDYRAAKEYIDSLQSRGSIPYGAFDKKGSNCSRFVTDTILASTFNPAIKKALQFNKKFTPSTVGNVEKASLKRKVFEVENGCIKLFAGTALKENLTNYFDKKRKRQSSQISQAKLPENVHKLTGTGSNAYFLITEEKTLGQNEYRIRRYNDLHEKDFDGVFFSEILDLSKPFTFTYDSHCAYCHLLQDGKKIRLDFKRKFEDVSLSQKAHSA